MATRSLPPVSAKVVADAEQFIAEFKRADRASRTAADNIEREVGDLAKNLKRKFSVGDVGKDLLKGFGLGSGMAVAEKAAEMIVGYYERAAEAAKSIEESTARQLDLVRQAIAAQQTDTQKLITLQKEYASKAKELADANAQKFAKVTTTSTYGVATSYQVVPREMSDDERVKASALAVELQELGNKIAEVSKRIKEKKDTETAAAAANDYELHTKSLTEGMRNQEEAFKALLDRKHDDNEQSARARKEVADLADKYKALADPLHEYHKALEELEKARSMLTAAEYVGARAAIDAQEEVAKNARVDRALDNFFGDMDRRSAAFGKLTTASEEFHRSVDAMFENVADRASATFADLVMEGKASFSSLRDMVVRAMIEMTTRLAIVNPLLNAVFGGAMGSVLPAFWGAGAAGAASAGAGAGARASGGSVDASYTYRVNENGQEFFKPDVGGVIIPVGASAAYRGRGEAKPTQYNFTYNIPAGVTRADLIPILQAQEQRTIATMEDMRRRRGGG